MHDADTNPYATPDSQLQSTVASTQVPSVQEALARSYDFGIDNVINQAWALVKGSKGLINGGYLLLYVVVFSVMFALAIVLSLLGLMDAASTDNSFVTEQLFNLLSSAVSYPFVAGIYLIAIRRAAGQEVSINLVFSQFSKFLPLLITGVLMTVLIAVGYLLLIVPGIYLSIAYLLAIPLVAERGLSPRQALETSRKAIHQHWFKVFGLCLTLGLITLLGIVPLGIGLIWTMPLLTLSFGVLYRIIFGVLPAAN